MNDTEKEEKKRRQMEWARKFWMYLIPVFALLILFMLYNWSQGKGNLRSILSPLTLIAIGLSTIFSTRNRLLQYVFLAIGIVLAVTTLVLLIIY